MSVSVLKALINWNSKTKHTKSLNWSPQKRKSFFSRNPSNRRIRRWKARSKSGCKTWRSKWRGPWRDWRTTPNRTSWTPRAASSTSSGSSPGRLCPASQWTSGTGPWTQKRPSWAWKPTKPVWRSSRGRWTIRSTKSSWLCAANSMPALKTS